MNSSSHLLVPESLQMTVVLLETIFTEGGHYSPVNNVWGGTNFFFFFFLGGGDTVHYDTVF